MTVQGITPSELKSHIQNQHEDLVLQSMLKSKRMEVHFLAQTSVLKNKDRNTFQEILGLEYSVNQRNIKQIKDNPLSSAAQTAQLMPLAPFKNKFIQWIWPKAQHAASLIGLDPKIVIAQAALETGWGVFIAKDAQGVSSYNLFNIKQGRSTQFDSVEINTTEYRANSALKEIASFRKYPSIDASFRDYIALIKGSPRYQKALANAGNPEAYLNELHKAGYASDPDYVTKILAIYHSDAVSMGATGTNLK